MNSFKSNNLSLKYRGLQDRVLNIWFCSKDSSHFSTILHFLLNYHVLPVSPFNNKWINYLNWWNCEITLSTNPSTIHFTRNIEKILWNINSFEDGKDIFKLILRNKIDLNIYSSGGGFYWFFLKLPFMSNLKSPLYETLFIMSFQIHFRVH